MPETYERINYSLRPAKSIERKMLGNAFRKLSDFGAIESYRYIGFGSTYFSDFVWFHKTLGIRHMISIERDRKNEERFRFNCPFRCIQIEWGDSNDIFPTLTWDVRTILWLDYDGELNENVLADVAVFCMSAIPGSMIVVTVNAEPDKPDPSSLDRNKEYFDQLHEYRLQKLIEQVGEEKIPTGVSGKDLAGWRKAAIYRKIITDKIYQTLNTRNGGRASGTEILYKQLFNFHYADGAKMLTAGGLIYDKGQSHIVAKCAFEELPFVELDSAPYLIETPRLTYRELRYLDTKLPLLEGEKLGPLLGIPEEQLDIYARMYRYFPTFAETEM